MTAQSIIRASAREAGEMSRDALAGFRAALGPGCLKPHRSLTEAEALDRVRQSVRWLRSVHYKLRTAHYQGTWDRLEIEQDDAWSELTIAIRDVRSARHAHKRLERFA